MKNKILLSIMAFVTTFFMVSCSDDDNYTSNTTPLISDSNVTTGTADVTPTSARLNGSVKGLDSQAASSYAVGFYYGSAADNLTETAAGSGDASAFVATVTGKPGETIYYQAYVTLQGKVTYKGSVQSLILTDAKAYTGGCSDVTASTARLSGTAEKFTDDSKVGLVISCKSDAESVRNGVKIETDAAEAFSMTALGLLPNTTYYYTAYLDLGGGVVYGEVKSFTTADKYYDAETDFVDLGLSTKWAKCNLGADTEKDLGGLFGFGDMTGFNTSIEPSEYASADIYKTAQDVCYKAYNGKATMPTVDEIQELFDCCKVEWVTEDNVSGYRFTGPNGNSIFMPAAGSRTQSTTTGVGTEGRYMTGTVNPDDSRYAESFIFTANGHGRSTTPVYQALSVRPVTVAKNAKFDKSLLYNTWEIDLTEDGSYKSFPCPVYFYKSEASWRSVSNNEPIIGGDLDWAPDSYDAVSWFISAKNTCQGYITFNEDGTVEVKHVAADGTETIEKGTYTLDEETKYIKLEGVTMLMPQVPDWATLEGTNLRILSLESDKAQISVTRADGEQVSINLVPQMEKYGYTAKLTCYGPTTDGSSDDQWASATTTVAGGKTGTYTVTFNTTHPRSAGQVYIIDIVGFGAAYPNAFVRVDGIKADGVDVKYDANKFFYGDIEGNGNFRIEMANIWGCGHNDSWNGLKDTPFHAEGGETTNETALAFNSTFEVTFTVVALEADLNFTAKQTAIGLDAGWAMPGNWGKENPGAVKVEMVNHQYQLVTVDPVALSLGASECDNGVSPSNGAVNLVDVVGIRNYFPGFACDLQSVVNDGANVPFDNSKIKYGDIEGNGNFRIELHNIWGSGTAADPAFGGATQVEGNNCVTALGFTKSSVYTIGNFSKNLFQKPW